MKRQTLLTTTIGELSITAVDDFVTEITYGTNVGTTYCAASDKILYKTVCQLTEYFAGKRTTFDIPLQMNGTEFQKKVWHELLKIPYGTTVTYGEIARRIGQPRASRAVGMACNKNCLPILIPCHRVVGKNGRLTGFSAGLDVKFGLLKLENTALFL